MIEVRKTTEKDLEDRLEWLCQHIQEGTLGLEQPSYMVLSRQLFRYPAKCRTRRQRKRWHEQWARLLGHRSLAGAKLLAKGEAVEISYDD